MGQRLFDQYSLLHMATGIIAYFFNASLPLWVALHILFEIVENSQIGIKVNNKYLYNIWPGGKPRADSVINSIGDTIASTIGWLLAYWIDNMGKKYGWYERS